MRALQFGLAAVASVAVVSAAVITLWMVGSATGERDKFASLEIAPRDAVFYVAINTDPASPQWLAVNDVLGTLNAKDPIREAIDEELAKFDLEFERDILPLAGDEGYLAVTDVEALSTDEGGLVIAFQLREPAKAEQIFLDVAAQEEAEYTKEAYEGETVYHAEGGFSGNREDQGAMSVAGDTIIIGVVPDDVKRVIDVIQGRAPSAVGNERLQALRERQEGDFLVWGYADMASVWDVLESGIPTDLGTSGDSVPIERFPLPTATPGETAAAGDFRITSFDSEYTINAGGALQVKETIAVDFGTVEKHGIHRDIPTLISYDFTNDESIRLEDIAVTRDGTPESFEGELAGDQFRVKAGDANVTITGQHTYEFRYTVAGGIRQHISDSPDAYYELLWNATGDAWPVPIERASVTVTTPNGTIDNANCHVGSGEFGIENYMPCQSTYDGPTARFVPDGPIEPGAGLQFILGVNGESRALPPVLVPVEESLDDPIFPFPEETDSGFPFGTDTQALLESLRETYDRLGFSVSARNDGFVVDLSVIQAEGADLPPAYGGTAFDSEFVKKVPTDAMAFFAGYDLYNGSYIPARDLMDKMGASEANPLDTAISDIEREIGIDLEDDLLRLMTGEYALAFNASGFDAAEPEFDVLGMIDVNDSEKIAATMEKFGDYLEQQDLARTEDGSRGGVRLWSPVDTPESIAWTVDADTLAVGYPESSVTGFLDVEGESLGDSADWKRTMGLLPQDKTSVFYVSLARILEEVRKIEGIEEEFETSTEGRFSLSDLAPVRTLAMASTKQDDGYGIRIVLLLEE